MTDVRATFNVTRAAWPHTLAQNHGRVVLTGSTGMSSTLGWSARYMSHLY